MLYFPVYHLSWKNMLDRVSLVLGLHICWCPGRGWIHTRVLGTPNTTGGSKFLCVYYFIRLIEKFALYYWKVCPASIGTSMVSCTGCWFHGRKCVCWEAWVAARCSVHSQQNRFMCIIKFHCKNRTNFWLTLRIHLFEFYVFILQIYVHTLFFFCP